MRKIILWTVLIALFVLSVVACTRSKSSGPVALPSPTGESTLSLQMPTSVGNAAATQTAAAAASQSGGSTPTNTMAPSPTSTPVPTQPPPTPTPKPKPQPTKPATVATKVPATYTLHEGEFPYCLARRFNIDPDALLAANSLSKGQWVYPGTTLTIPKNAGAFPYARALRPHPTTYTVQAGDTFYSIACKFGDVWPEAIAAANGMSVNANLTPGLTLHIP